MTKSPKIEKSEPVRCCERTWPQHSMRSFPCRATASVERDGKPYCGRHDPVKRKAKSDAKMTTFLYESAVRKKRLQMERASEDLLAMAHEVSGPDGYLLDQIATFIGGLCDAYKLDGETKAVAESYYETLHRVAPRVRFAIAKAEGNA